MDEQERIDLETEEEFRAEPVDFTAQQPGESRADWKNRTFGLHYGAGPRASDVAFEQVVLINAERVQLAAERDALREQVARHRPWLFEPGDHVLCLMPTATGQIIVSGVVQQIRIPGPLRTEKVIQVQMDDDNMFPEAQGLAWWPPDLVERIHG